MPRYDEHLLVSPAETDYGIGYRPGLRGIRFTIASIALKVAQMIDSSAVTSAFGQVGDVTRLYLPADDGSRHEVVVRLVQGTSPPVYEILVDQTHTPE
jgi:hypothetical protein